MRTALLVFVLSMASLAQAKPLTFTLECRWAVSAVRPPTDPDFQVVKTALKKDGHWTTEFTLIARSHANESSRVVYQLEEASGDEGYLVYKVLDDTKSKFSWVTIENQFNWATISTNEGNYECRN